MRIIDADGHVNDYAGGDEIAKFMPEGNRSSEVFPVLDHLHFQYLRKYREPIGNPDSKDWDEFLEKSGIECTVVYPSAGLAVGRIVDSEWAIAACRAYNNWLHEKFVSVSGRIKGMALIPVQDVEAGASELRRAVTDLGMCGAMLPSNGEGIKGHLGSRVYWPIYEEAEKLGCCLAVHGGSHQQEADGGRDDDQRSAHGGRALLYEMRLRPVLPARHDDRRQTLTTMPKPTSG